MRKKYLPFIAIAIMTFFVACSNEELITEENTEPQVEGQTITLTATMPDEGPATRVALTPDEKNINLTWQSGDRLQFAIVQGAIKEKVVVALVAGNITNDGKTVSFNIPLPTDEGFDENEDFDLYGLYGFESATPEAGGLSDANPTNVILTKNPGNVSNTLTAVQNRGDVMLYFKEEGVNTLNLPETVSFQHLGSLFAISFNNTETASAASATQIRLVGVDDDGNELTTGNWAYNNGAGGQLFDLTGEQFQNPTSGGNHISFALAGSSFTVEQTTTFWGWYPLQPGASWPALILQITDSSGDAIISSVNFKPQRPSAPVAGKVYHFYARWDGSALNFTNDQFVVTPAN